MENNGVRLRRLLEKDAARMLEWMQDAEAVRYLNIGGMDTGMQQVLRFIQNAQDDVSNIHRAIVDANDMYLGTVSLKHVDYEKREAEYAIAMHPTAWGTGAARTATRLISEMAFQMLGLGRIYLNVLEDNGRAVRFYEHNGFVRTGETETTHRDTVKKLLWYEMKDGGGATVSLDKKQKIVFFTAVNAQLCGGRKLFLDYGMHLADQLGYDTYYIANGLGEMEQENQDSKLKILDANEVDFSLFRGAIVFTAFNHLFYLLARIQHVPDIKICLYYGHPNIFNWLDNQVPFSQKQGWASALEIIREKNALCLQDGSNLLAANKISAQRFDPCFVPPILHEPEQSCNKSHAYVKGKIRFLWLGRLDNDKVQSIINCLYNLLAADLDMAIEFHIIGDGNAKDKIVCEKYAPKVDILFTSYLYGEARDSYIRQHADIAVAMGISAMDCAMLGVPTVIPVVSDQPFSGDRYVYIFDAPAYSLGWNQEDLERLGAKTHSIREVIDAVCDDPDRRAELIMRGMDYCRQTFSLENGSRLLLNALARTELTVQDCISCRLIRKQMKQYALFCKLSRRSGFDRYHAFVSRMNGIQSVHGWKKLAYYPNELRKTIQNRIGQNPLYNRAAARLAYSRYPAKIRAIRKVYRSTKKMKVAFLVLFNGVFPFRAVFEKMCTDSHFDPWIIVIPNATRTREYQQKKYSEAFHDLSQQYGNRVLHGYDWEKEKILELHEDFQIVFFNNPYDQLVHREHGAKYFAHRNVLMLYANYGFAALKYWDEVIGTEFFNSMWKVCVETEGNLEYLKQHELLQGKNGLVTGYLKMDSFANYQPSGKKRKMVLICPHHTVWGWNKLNISNFLTYADLFIELPKKFPELDFVFRPHPLLFDNLVANKIWTEEQVETYLARLLASPNMTYDKSGDYFQTFCDSDAMIHDCGSFIGEYLFTEKPCCYLLKSEEQVSETLLPLGQACMEQYYHASRAEEIERFIQDVVIEGHDPLKEQREAFSRTVLKKYYPFAADRIIQEIKDCVIGQDEIATEV